MVICHKCHRTRSARAGKLGDGSVGKVLAVHHEDPSPNPQHSCKNQALCIPVTPAEVRSGDGQVLVVACWSRLNSELWVQ